MKPSGFRTLEQALAQLGDQIDASLDSLCQSLTTTISVGLAAQTSELINATAQQTSALVDASTSQTAALARQSASLRDELRASRRVAENEARARIRSDVSGGDIFAR